IPNSSAFIFGTDSYGLICGYVTDTRPSSGMYLEYYFAVAVSNCTFNNGQGIYYVGYGDQKSSFVNNTCSYCIYDGIQITSGINYLSNPYMSGVTLVGNTCNNNTIGSPGNPDIGGNGIELDQCTEVVVSSTRANDNSNSPVHTFQCLNCNISGTAGTGNGQNVVTDSTAYPSQYSSTTNPELDQLTLVHAGL